MKYGICGINLLIVFFTGSLIADTRIDQLKKVFDASYKSTYGMKENLLKKELRAEPVVECMMDIDKYVEQNVKSFRAAFDEIMQAMVMINSFIDQFYLRFVKPVKGEMVMLTFKQWQEIKELSKDYLSKANEHIQKAQVALAESKTFKTEIRETKDLLTHVIINFNELTAKLLKEIQESRNAEKIQKFSQDEALAKSKELLAISQKNTDPHASTLAVNKNTWKEIMNVIGFDETVSKEKRDAAWAKFDIYDGKNIDSGVVFAGKGQVKIAINTLYEVITRQTK
jgi:hypothetical protein